MMSLVLPAFAARTPKPGQIFVKVVDTNGKSVGKVYVNVWNDDTGDSTRWKATKGSGMVIFDIYKDPAHWNEWVEGTHVTVLVLRNDVSVPYLSTTLEAGPTLNVVVVIDTTS